MQRLKPTTLEKISAEKFRIGELRQEYCMLLYFETMPEHDELYKYCYSTSNMKVSHEFQDVDFWLRAVIKHMSLRRRGHGGEYTDSILVQMLTSKLQTAVNRYIDYIAAKLHKKMDVKKPRKTPVG